MIGFSFRHTDETSRVKKAANDASFRNLGHAAASIRLTARRLIKKSKSYAAAGEPVRTRDRRLPNAIVYDVSKNKQYAIVGPAYSLAGPVGGAHEHGGMFRRRRYDKRSFMAPSLDRNTLRFATSFGGSIG
jgi:hypothetical protein